MKDNYYFDNAATTLPKPEPVYLFMDKFFRSHGVNPGRSGHELAIEAETMIIQTRRMLGEFFGFGGDSNRVTVSLNATDSMNLALLGLLDPGDHMIITRVEHNAVLRPANHLERDGGVTVSYTHLTLPTAKAISTRMTSATQLRLRPGLWSRIMHPTSSGLYRISKLSAKQSRTLRRYSS